MLNKKQMVGLEFERCAHTQHGKKEGKIEIERKCQELRKMHRTIY